MKRHLKSAIFFALYYSGLEWLLARILPVNAAAVLMYHGVANCAEIPPEINFHVRPDVFERQMRALKKRYRVITLSDLMGRLEHGRPLEKTVAITFDDGYRNNATQAAPVLEKLKLPYTVFLATRYIGTEDFLPLNRVYWAWSQGRLDPAQTRDLRNQVRTRPAVDMPEILAGLPESSDSPKAAESFAMLDWDEIREMAGAGAHFCSHTHSHCNMAVEPKESQEQELRTSHQLIDQNVPAQPALFAYPFGHREQMSQQSREAIISAGFRAAISAEYGLVTSNSDVYSVPRLGYDDKIWNFACEIAYQFAKQWLRADRLAPADTRSSRDVKAQTN